MTLSVYLLRECSETIGILRILRVTNGWIFSGCIAIDNRMRVFIRECKRSGKGVLIFV